MVYAKLNELYHHGIKGQKWGIRRYQNEDGSLTAAGRRRKKLLQKAGDIASENAKQLDAAYNRVKKRYDGGHARYDGPNGWKVYAQDVYSTTDHRDLKMTEKEFKAYMQNELNSLMTADDIRDKRDMRRYSKAAKEWTELANGFYNFDVANLDKKTINAARTFISMNKLGLFTLDSLVESIED